MLTKKAGRRILILFQALVWPGLGPQSVKICCWTTSAFSMVELPSISQVKTRVHQWQPVHAANWDGLHWCQIARGPRVQQFWGVLHSATNANHTELLTTHLSAKQILLLLTMRIAQFARNLPCPYKWNQNFPSSRFHARNMVRVLVFVFCFLSHRGGGPELASCGVLNRTTPACNIPILISRLSAQVLPLPADTLSSVHGCLLYSYALQ